MTTHEMYVVRYRADLPPKRVPVLPVNQEAYAQQVESVRKDDERLTHVLVYTNDIKDAFVYTSVEQAQFDVDRFNLGEIVPLSDLLPEFLTKEEMGGTS
jgi:hypothetical protein